VKWTWSFQVIQYRRYPQPHGASAPSNLIEKVGGNLIGILLNNINMSQDESYYYYTGYYHGQLLLHTRKRRRSGNSRQGKKIPMTPTRSGLNKSIDCAPSFVWIRDNEIILESNSLGFFACGLLFTGVIFTGCYSPSSNPIFSDTPIPPVMIGFAHPQAIARWRLPVFISVTLSRWALDGLPEINRTTRGPIKEDGTITMPDIGHVQAAGKTAGELQNENI